MNTMYLNVKQGSYIPTKPSTEDMEHTPTISHTNLVNMRLVGVMQEQYFHAYGIINMDITVTDTLTKERNIGTTYIPLNMSISLPLNLATGVLYSIPVVEIVTLKPLLPTGYTLNKVNYIPYKQGYVTLALLHDKVFYASCKLGATSLILKDSLVLTTLLDSMREQHKHVRNALRKRNDVYIEKMYRGVKDIYGDFLSLDLFKLLMCSRHDKGEFYLLADFKDDTADTYNICVLDTTQGSIKTTIPVKREVKNITIRGTATHRCLNHTLATECQLNGTYMVRCLSLTYMQVLYIYVLEIMSKDMYNHTLTTTEER